MFTGLVDAQGVLRARKIAGRGGARLTIYAPYTDIALGESIAVDGVCLTVDRILATGFEADASSETLEKSTLGGEAVGATMNLERAMRADGRFGGHIVSGHVDGVGHLMRREPLGNAEKFIFSMPKELARFIAEKGSITIAGTSLTVNEAGTEHFAVAVIPHTGARTKLDGLAAGAAVNLEVDVVARYLARLLAFGAPSAAAGGAAGESSDDAWRSRLAALGYL
jgi:riboflavin synthase